MGQALENVPRCLLLLLGYFDCVVCSHHSFEKSYLRCLQIIPIFSYSMVDYLVEGYVRSSIPVLSRWCQIGVNILKPIMFLITKLSTFFREIVYTYIASAQNKTN